MVDIRTLAEHQVNLVEIEDFYMSSYLCIIDNELYSLFLKFSALGLLQDILKKAQGRKFEKE